MEKCCVFILFKKKIFFVLEKYCTFAPMKIIVFMHRLSLLIIVSVFTVQINGQDNTDTIPKGNRKSSQTDFRSLVREGNKQYNTETPADAERSYREALDIDEKSNIATYNLGNALYRQQKYDDAVNKFENSASATDNKMDKARAYHNLGNSYLQQQKLKESIEAYKQALRNNPDDLETKYNLSYAMNLLKQQEQQNQDNKDKQDKQDNQENKDNKDNQDNQDNKDNQDDQQEQKDDKTQQQQISPEDAKRLLDAIAQEEKELLEKIQQKERAGHRQKIEKNW